MKIKKASMARSSQEKDKLKYIELINSANKERTGKVEREEEQKKILKREKKFLKRALNKNLNVIIKHMKMTQFDKSNISYNNLVKIILIFNCE